MTFVRFQVLLFRHTREYNSRFLLRCSPPKKTLHFLGAEKMNFAFKRTVFFYGLTIRQVELHLRFTPGNRQVELNNLRHCTEAAEEPLWRHAAPGSVAWPWCRQYHIKHYKAI